MGYLTQHGFLWGKVPETTGRVLWVSPSATYTIAGISYSASDDNDGLSPERALRTVAKAWTFVTATSGDIIVLLPGAHTVTATLAANIAGVTMMGLPRYSGGVARPITSLTISASADIITLSASNVEIAWLHFIPVTTKTCLAITTALATGAHIHHCSVDLDTAAASTSTKGFTLSSSSSYQGFHYVHDCVFYCDSAQGAGIDMGSATAAGASLIERCSFIQSTGTWARAMVSAASSDAGRGNLVRVCDFIAAADATMTVGISGVGGTATEESCHVHRCYFSDSVSVAVDFFGARGAEIAENYQSGVGATDGGVLITAIT